MNRSAQSEIEERKLRRRYRLRVAIFFLCAVLVLVVMSTLYEATRTLGGLETAERERDQWQRAGDIIHELSLNEGSVVVDFGSGVGYFTLKLAHNVGETGKVLPVDIQRFPLEVLRARAVIERLHNVDIVVGEPDNPRLAARSCDAILVVNTYHELVHPEPIFENLYRSLKPGGRLVIVDRGLSPTHKSAEPEEHAIAPEEVEITIRRQGFEVIGRDDQFTKQPGDGLWWMIVARKPS